MTEIDEDRTARRDRESEVRQPRHRADPVTTRRRKHFELEPRCRRIMFDPDHRNSGARRLCEYVGCDFLGEHDMSNRRMALYALRRESIISA